MKKMMSILLVALVAIGFALPAAATGAITAAEQTILDELNVGVTVNGQTFNFDQANIAQTENYLKANDVQAATAAAVVVEIKATRQLIIDNSAGIVATSLNDLIAQLPKSVRDQILNHITAAANALGLTVTVTANGLTITDKAGTVVINPSTAKNPVVKATGANYTTSLLVFTSLMIVALGAAIVGKKYVTA